MSRGVRKFMESVLGRNVEKNFVNQIEDGTAIEFLMKLVPNLQLVPNKGSTPFNRIDNIKIFNKAINNSFGFKYFFL
jgi:hypothetical protein